MAARVIAHNRIVGLILLDGVDDVLDGVLISEKMVPIGETLTVYYWETCEPAAASARRFTRFS
jgi:hypothetical protein